MHCGAVAFSRAMQRRQSGGYEGGGAAQLQLKRAELSRSRASDRSRVLQDSHQQVAEIFEVLNVQHHQASRMAACRRLSAHRIAAHGGARDHVAPVAR